MSDCPFCVMLHTKHGVLKNAAHYKIIQYQDKLYAVLKQHLTEAEGCSSCIEGYMKDDIYEYAMYKWGHTHTSHLDISTGHLVIYAEPIKGIRR